MTPVVFTSESLPDISIAVIAGGGARLLDNVTVLFWWVPAQPVPTSEKQV